MERVKTVIRARHADLQASGNGPGSHRALLVGLGGRGNRTGTGGHGGAGRGGGPPRTDASTSGTQPSTSTSTSTPPTSTPTATPTTNQSPTTTQPPTPTPIPSRKAGEVCHRCHKPGHFVANCPSRTCTTCEGRGHGADVCPTIPSLVAAEDNDEDVFTKVEAVAFIGEMRDGELFDGDADWEGHDGSDWQVGDECWVADSGASIHITPNAEHMYNMRPSKAKIIAAGGIMYDIKGYGTLCLNIRSRGTSEFVKLNRVACLLYTSPSPRDS